MSLSILVLTRSLTGGQTGAQSLACVLKTDRLYKQCVLKKWAIKFPDSSSQGQWVVLWRLVDKNSTLLEPWTTCNGVHAACRHKKNSDCVPLCPDCEWSESILPLRDAKCSHSAKATTGSQNANLQHLWAKVKINKRSRLRWSYTNMPWRQLSVTYRKSIHPLVWYWGYCHVQPYITTEALKRFCYGVQEPSKFHFYAELNYSNYTSWENG